MLEGFLPFVILTECMANVYYWLKQVRQTREEEGLLRERFERFEPAYLEALEEVEDEAGEEAVDELAEWLLTYAREHEELPKPLLLREQAVEVCRRHGVEPSKDSSLYG